MYVLWRTQMISHTRYRGIAIFTPLVVVVIVIIVLLLVQTPPVYSIGVDIPAPSATAVSGSGALLSESFIAFLFLLFYQVVVSERVTNRLRPPGR